MDNLELYELVLKDDADEVFALSLVDAPAIQSNFVYLNKDGKKVEVKFASLDEDKRLIVGPILIPDLKILRQDSPKEKPYEVFFSKDTVKNIAQEYVKDGYANNITVDHEKPVKDVALVESWIVDSTIYDKSKMYGLSLKPGTWAGVFKVNNEDVWQKVKAGDFKGISLEGYFTHLKAQKFAKVDLLNKNIEELTDEEAEIVLAEILKELEAQPSISSTYAGEPAKEKKKKQSWNEVFEIKNK